MTTPRTTERARPTAESTDDFPSTSERGSLGGAVRKAVLAVGVFAVAYLAARRLSSGGNDRPGANPTEIDVPGVRRLTGESAEVTIGGDDDEATTGEEDEATSSTEATEGETEASDPEADASEGGPDAADPAADATEAEASPSGDESTAGDEADPPEVEPGPPDEVIEERAEPDVETDPREPGEMTVDDDLVEEVVDEDDDSGGPAADE